MLLTATAFDALRNPESDYDRQSLWRHSMASAMAAERLGKRLNIQVDGIFAAGLLHDVGKVALDCVAPHEFAQAVVKAHNEKRFLRETEPDLFGMDHAQVGGHLALHWNFPEPIVEAVQRHHQPDEDSPNRTLVAIAAMADFITYQAGYPEGGNGRDAEFPETAAKILNMDANGVAQVADDICAADSRIEAILSVLQ